MIGTSTNGRFGTRNSCVPAGQRTRTSHISPRRSKTWESASGAQGPELERDHPTAKRRDRRSHFADAQPEAVSGGESAEGLSLWSGGGHGGDRPARRSFPKHLPFRSGSTARYRFPAVAVTPSTPPESWPRLPCRALRFRLSDRRMRGSRLRKRTRPAARRSASAVAARDGREARSGPLHLDRSEEH